MTNKELARVRSLASEYMEMATSQKQNDAKARFIATNDLKIVRPPVLIDEIPWHELGGGGELDCVCEDQRLRELEYFFLQAKYRWKHFECDTNFDPFFKVVTKIESNGIGVEKKNRKADSHESGDIVSREYEDVFEDESSVDLIKIPTFKLRPDIDEENMNFYSDVLGNVMPVKLCGRNYIYHAPWDVITEYRGMTNILFDFYDRPEHLHAIRRKFMEITTAELDFVEKHSFVDDSSSDLHCTPAQISGREGTGWKATWFRTMAQPFSDVSPEMFEEFELPYVIDMAKRFAYTYYGCCEPLDKKISVIKKIDNLRKIGVSPWANVHSCAEQIGGDYVFARKPNPANVALSTDPDVIYKETEETVKACIKNGCPCEFVLKDISTVSNKPENLDVWAKTVSAVLDKYYGR